MTEKEFVKKWNDKIKETLPNFPKDYLTGTEVREFKMPAKPLTLGTELFGQFEIVDSEGNAILQTDNYSLIKYVLYSNRIRPSKILIPQKDSDISKIVSTYGTQLDSIMKEIKLELSKVLPTSDFLKVSNQIFNSLNLSRY